MSLSAQNCPITDEDVPRLPSSAAAMSTIVRAAGDPAVSLAQLAELVGNEPSFTVELLRLANSAYYAPRAQGVRTVAQATVVFGARTLRNFAVAHVVRTMGQKMDTGRLDVPRFWEDSLRRAVVARHVAPAFEVDPMEAFTVGLIQDTGVLLMAAARKPDSEKLQAAMALSEHERLDREKRLFGRIHSDIFATAAKRWQLPEEMVFAIQFHHDQRPPAAAEKASAEKLRMVCRIADLVSDIWRPSARAEEFWVARDALQKAGGIELQSVVETVRESVPVAARQLGMSAGRQASWDEMYKLCLDSIAEMARENEVMRRERDELASELDRLRRENAQLMGGMRTARV